PQSCQGAAPWHYVLRTPVFLQRLVRCTHQLSARAGRDRARSQDQGRDGEGVFSLRPPRKAAALDGGLVAVLRSASTRGRSGGASWMTWSNCISTSGKKNRRWLVHESRRAIRRQQDRRQKNLLR